MTKLTLPTDSTVRKDIPLYSGCYTYFPAALAGVAMHSKAGNDKHNPGEPLHHARGKSMDHADCIARHSMDIADMLIARDRSANKYPADDLLAEVNALCWRALAWSQEIHEKYAGAPLAPAARVEEKFPLVRTSKSAQYIHSKQCTEGACTGQCYGYVNRDAATEPVKACSDSLASAQTQTQSYQTLAPNRAWSHDHSQDQPPAEKGLDDLYHRV